MHWAEGSSGRTCSHLFSLCSLAQCTRLGTVQLGAEQLGAEQLGTEQLNREGFTLQPFGIPADFGAVSDRDSTSDSGVFLDGDVVYQTLLLPSIHFKHPMQGSENHGYTSRAVPS